MFREETPISIFRKNTAADLELIYDDLDRSLDLSFDYYSQLEGQLTKFLPTLGKQVATYLKKQEFEKLSLKEQYQNLMALLDFLNGAHLFVNLEQGVPQLSFFEGDTVLWEGNSTFEALKKLEFYWFNVVVFTQQKKVLIKVEEKKLKKLKRDLKKLDVKLNELNHGQNKKELADIIMANLHNFDRTKVKTTLFDFYNNIDIEVEIKRGMTPQDFAGRLYKKSKNQHLELSHTQTAIEFKEKEVVKAEGTVAMINGLTSWKELRKCQPSKLQKQKVIVAPSFKEFDFAGYRIYVGRNSKNNDELTLKFAKKDDLWLHAKDVPGSHVVIKKKSDKNVPKDVIEYAAILAGKFSKRKTDSLCPVTVTPKKYVRKMKGARAGSVIVEREEVVLVKLN